MSELIKKLSEPLPFHWRISRLNRAKGVAECVPYIDARDAMNRLDQVLGPFGWQDDYKDLGGKIYCTVKILYLAKFKSSASIEEKNAGRGVWYEKSDCGMPSDIEGDKGQASDAFKRACVKWGLGRFLYAVPPMYCPVREFGKTWYPFDPVTGARIEDLTQFFEANPGLTTQAAAIALFKTTKS